MHQLMIFFQAAAVQFLADRMMTSYSCLDRKLCGQLKVKTYTESSLTTRNKTIENSFECKIREIVFKFNQ